MSRRLAGTLAGALVVLLGLGGAPASPPGEDPAFGRWLVEDGEAVIQIEPCGDGACGRLVWLARPFEAGGEPKRDMRNPDPSKRGRPLCKMRMISGLARAAPGVWKDGRVYSARDGQSYSFRIEDVEGDRMTVRGYLGLPVLGRTQVWTRADHMRGSCTPFEAPGHNR